MTYSYLKGNHSFIFSYFRFLYLLNHSIKAEIVSIDFHLFTFRRLLILWFLSWFIPVIMIWNHVGLVLDDILFPEWKNVDIGDPLFIVGNARSGTTWIHRILSQDEEKFTFFRTWEIIFGVSVAWRSMILQVYYVDTKIFNGICSKIINIIEKTLIGDLKVHPIGLQLAEEDEWLMIHICKSQLLMMIFPLAGDLLGDLVLFDKSMDANTRCNIMNFYKDCVKRHMYVRNINNNRIKNRSITKRVFVSKNPPFTLRLKTLTHLFPSAKFVCMVRDPVESIPSMVSYISLCWHTFASPTIAYPRYEDLVMFCREHYSHPLDTMPDAVTITKHIINQNENKKGNKINYEKSDKIHPYDNESSNSGNMKWNGSAICNPCVFLPYALLKGELVSTLNALFEILVYPSSVFVNHDILKREQELVRGYTSHHHHNPEICGVTMTEMKEDFKFVYKAHHL